MTNMYSVEIQRGCCSCKYNYGTRENPRVDCKAKSCMCDQYDCEVSRAGKESCQYYGMKDWLWNFNPANSKGHVKPKAFFDWLHSITAAEHESIVNAVKFNKNGETVPKYSNMWKAWIDTTTDGIKYIATHPDMR